MFVDAIVMWQSKAEIGNAVIGATLNAIGSCKALPLSVLILLEATTFNYFRYLGMTWIFLKFGFVKFQNYFFFVFVEATKKYHSPTWRNVCARLGPKLASIDPKQLIDGDYLLCLHLFIIYKLKEQPDSGAKITFLQNIFKQLENYSTT